MNVRDWIISKRSSTPLQAQTMTENHVKQRGHNCAPQQLPPDEVAQLRSTAPPFMPSPCGIWLLATAIYILVCTLTPQTLSRFLLSHINAIHMVASAFPHANTLVPISANPTKTSPMKLAAAAAAHSMTWIATDCDPTVCSSLCQ